MARAKKKAIPAKRGTKRARTRRTKEEPRAAEHTVDKMTLGEHPPGPHGHEGNLALLVDITPLNRVRDGYREADVVAVNDGVVAGKRRKKGDLFRIGVIGNGPLPPSVRTP